MTKRAPFEISTLAENPECFNEVMRLIEKEFQYTSDHSFLTDFSPLLNPLNHENCFFVIDTNQNRVVSHLALCPRAMIKNNLLLDVAFIGGIATDSEFRNKGLFKMLMTYVLEKNVGVFALYILWSDITGLYEKFNFYLAGGTVETGTSLLTNSENPDGFHKTKFNLIDENEFEEIKHLYKEFNEKKFFTVKREEKDWSLIKSMSSVDLYIKKDPDGKIIQYFCINKGKDLTDIIYEIGCLKETYLPLIKKISRYKLWLPEEEKNISDFQNIFFTAFIKLGDPNKLNAFFHKLLKEKLNITNFDEERINFHFKNEDYNLSQQDFLTALFGPNPILEFSEFNLSPYISGLDSI